MKCKSKIFLILVAMMLCVCFIGSVSAEEVVKGPIDITPIKDAITIGDVSKMKPIDISNMLRGVTKSQLVDIISVKPNMEDKVSLIVSSPELKSNAKLEMQNEVFGMTSELSTYLKSKPVKDVPSKPTADDVQKETEWNAYLLNYVTYYKGTGEFGGPIV